MKKLRKSIAIALVLSLFIGNISSVALAKGIGDFVPDFGKKISAELSFYDDYSKRYDGTTAAEGFDLTKGKLEVSSKNAKSFFDRNEDKFPGCDAGDKFPGCSWPEFNKKVCNRGISLNGDDLYIKSADVYFEDADVAVKRIDKKKLIHIDNIVWGGEKLSIYDKIIDLPESAIAEGKILKSYLKLDLPELVTKVYDGSKVKKNVPVVIDREKLPVCDKDAVIEVSGIFNSEDAACAKYFYTGLSGIKKVENINLDNYWVSIDDKTNGQILPAEIEGLSDKTVEYKAEDKGIKSFDIDEFGVIPENIRGEWEITDVTDPSGIIGGKARLGALTDNVIYNLSDTEDGGEAVVTLKFTSKHDCNFQCKKDKEDAKTYSIKDCCNKDKDKCNIKKCGEGNYVTEVKLTIKKAAKEVAPVVRDLTVKYVLEDGTVISTEVLKVQNGTTRITYNDLKNIPEGYEVVNKYDRNILDTTTEVEILVEKTEVDPSDKPEVDPSDKPNVDPSDKPEVDPSDKPDVDPSDKPEVDPSDKPEVDPSDKPEVDPSDKPETGDTDVDPSDKPETGDTDVDPQDKPETGDTDVDPQDKPEAGDTDVDPQNKPEAGDTDVNPQDKPEAGQADNDKAVQKTAKAEADEEKGTPETGDNSDLIAYMVLLMMAGSGAVALKRKHEK